MIETLDTLVTALRAAPAAPAYFAAGDDRTQGNWHITRLTHSAQAHVDCDGGRDDGREAVIELLDARWGEPMPVPRLVDILDRSAAAIPGLRDADLRVHWRSTRYRVAAVEDGTVRLEAEDAKCRPALWDCC